MKPFLKRIAPTFCALAFLTTPAHAIDVKKETIINAPITKVWEKIGDWCSIKDWHPAIVSCRPEQKGEQLRRFLESSDGRNAKELFINKTDYSVTYFIEKSTLPLVGYKATIALSPAENNKTKIT